MIYKVYVLENLKRDWYIGHTDNLNYRLARHNNNLVRSTKNKGPWRVIYTEEFRTRAEAMKREEYLKSGRGRKYLKEFLNKKRC